MNDPIFVFGSNLAGRHGKGAALWARQHRGAIYDTFLAFARSRPDLTFQLTPIGCGLAGYRREQIEPMFASAPTNVLWPTEWR